jgi:hypothetical protein
LSILDHTAIPNWDTPLWRAVAHVAEKIGEHADELTFEAAIAEGKAYRPKTYPQTRALIRQKALDGTLILWGRKQLDNQSPHDTQRRFSEVLTVIPSDYWASSKISPYGAVEQEFVNNPYTQPESRTSWPNEQNSYADIRVSWQQVTGCWPEDASQSEILASEIEAPTMEERGKGDARRELIDAFILKVEKATGRDIKRTDIWTVAGYKDRTEFERFQRNERVTETASDNFTRVLNLEPKEFIETLDKKRKAQVN